MPNTTSAKKALRQSFTKKAQNNFWKIKVKNAVKNIDKMFKSTEPNVEALTKETAILQKVVDKSANKHVLTKNKAGRMKSKYAQKLFTLAKKDSKPVANTPKVEKATKPTTTRVAAKPAAKSKSTAAKPKAKATKTTKTTK